MAGTGYSPYTGAGNLASAFGANPNFGGSVGGYGGGTGGYQSGGYQYPNNVGGVNYSGAAPSGYAWGANGLVPIGTGQAGNASAYNPWVAQQAQFEAPTFTNSMSNWLGGGGQNVEAMQAYGGGGFQYPGSNSGTSAWDPWGVGAAQTQMLANLGGTGGYGFGSGDMGQRGGTGGSVANTMAGYAGGGMGYPAYGLSNLAWATGAPTSQQANQAMAGVLSDQSARNYGLINNNPGNVTMTGFTSGLPGFAGQGQGYADMVNKRYPFASYNNMLSGVNAGEANLGAYGQHGINTPADIFNIYAPKSPGNNPTAYAGTVANNMGVTPTSHLNMSDPWTQTNLMSGISSVETGTPYSSIQNAITNAPQNQVYANAANAAINGLYGAGQQSVGHGGR